MEDMDRDQQQRRVLFELYGGNASRAERAWAAFVADGRPAYCAALIEDRMEVAAPSAEKLQRSNVRTNGPVLWTPEPEGWG